MNFANEYALLFAVALPVAVIAGMQVALYLSGERTTLLVPGMAGYPTFEKASRVRLVDLTPSAWAGRAAPAASNEEFEPLAA